MKQYIKFRATMNDYENYLANKILEAFQESGFKVKLMQLIRDRSYKPSIYVRGKKEFTIFINQPIIPHPIGGFIKQEYLKESFKKFLKLTDDEVDILFKIINKYSSIVGKRTLPLIPDFVIAEGIISIREIAPKEEGVLKAPGLYRIMNHIVLIIEAKNKQSGKQENPLVGILQIIGYRYSVKRNEKCHTLLVAENFYCDSRKLYNEIDKSGVNLPKDCFLIFNHVSNDNPKQANDFRQALLALLMLSN